MTQVNKIVSDNLDPNSRYAIRVRTINSVGVPSPWSKTLSVYTGDDAVGPPIAPTDVEVTPGIRTIVIKYTPVTVSDFAKYELYINPGVFNFIPGPHNFVDSFSQTNTYIASKYNNGSSLVDLVPGTTYSIKLRAIDVAGNLGPFTPAAYATTGFLENSDVAFASLIADKIAAGSITGQAIEISGGSSGYIQSAGFDPLVSTTGWRIDGAGNAWLYSATIVTNITAGSIHIGGNDATSFHVDTSGNMWVGAGNSSFSSAPFRVSSSGALTVTGATITGGTIQTAASGSRVLLTNAATGEIRFHSGDGLEVNPALVRGGVTGNANSLILNSGNGTGLMGGNASEMRLQSGTAAHGNMSINTSFLTFDSQPIIAYDHGVLRSIPLAWGLTVGTAVSLGSAPGIAQAMHKTQWGTTVATTNASGDFTLMFPSQFTNGLTSIVVSNGDVGSSNAQQHLLFSTGIAANGAASAAGTLVHVYDTANHTGLANTTVRVNWQAWGW